MLRQTLSTDVVHLSIDNNVHMEARIVVDTRTGIENRNIAMKVHKENANPPRMALCICPVSQLACIAFINA